MRFLSFIAGGTTQFGALIDERVVSLSERMPEYASLRSVLAAGALVRAADIAASSSADYELADVQLLPPIPDPGKIICIDGNYRDSGPPAEFPGVYLRTRESLVGHGRALLRPPESNQLDYEGEIALVMGRGGRRIAAADALKHVAGMTLVNEGTVRDWIRAGAVSIAPGKNFEASGAMGPWLVSAEECPPGETLTLTTRVNGELRQQAATDQLRHGFAELISYVSTFMPLNPGDVIATGSPAGCGASLAPPRFLAAGDQVEITVTGLGTLANRIEDERVD
ncbi:MAG: fumarylacetoacetate hydrolase family protein [Pseudomonadales bacterium]